MHQALDAARKVYGDDIPIKALRLLDGVERLQRGEDPKVVAKLVGTTAKRLSAVAAAHDPVVEALGCSVADATSDEKLLKQVQRGLGQMLVGHLAEHQFETIYQQEMGTDQLKLEDDRTERNDTDYRVLNGGGRKVFRINIKFSGTRFQKAKELVGLDSEDCFALATYKIKQGLDKQQEEVLPYLFVIVDVPDLKGETAGEAVPLDLRRLCTLVFKAPKATGKRDLEDAIVEHLMGSKDPAFRAALAVFEDQVAKAKWYVLSARKADKLLREHLFERVYAVRVRAFARNYPNAELDMHFSLKGDLTPLRVFLHKVKELGLPQIMGHLERGTI